MREIKFRIWDNLKKEWVTNKHIWRMKTDANGIGEIHPHTFYWKQHPHGLAYQQYTGLKYKNNQEIYEGDIFNTLSARWIVVFENGCFYAKACAGWNFEVKQQILLIDSIDSTHIPLGNVLEHPELLNILPKIVDN